MVSVLMGSKSDWEVMCHTSLTLKDFSVEHDCKVLSAHRTPEQLVSHIKKAEKEGVRVFIAGAGAAAHLAGVVASQTLLPVLGVPLSASSLNGLDSLLSTVQMPAGMPVATFAIGKAGAINAALCAVQILGLQESSFVHKMKEYRAQKAEKILNEKLDY